MARSILVLVAALAVCFGVAAFGARFEPGPWYQSLSKPAWNPPDWLFAPVWTVLYFLMALAAWLVWRQAGLSQARLALSAFGVQLALNAAWSWLFFGLHRPDLALIEIGLLWAAILTTLILFARIHTLAGILLLPYLAWVGFAAVLNFSLWRLNS